MMLYANVSRGQKSAAFPTVAGTVASQFAPAKPETVIAYEVGAKATGLGGRVRISAAAFHYDYRDKQVRGKTIDPNIGPVGALVNITRSSVWGGEVTVDAEPLKGSTSRPA
jgi:outer membrane receptor protein involved in Fe transport